MLNWKFVYSKSKDVYVVFFVGLSRRHLYLNQKTEKYGQECEQDPKANFQSWKSLPWLLIKSSSNPDCMECQVPRSTIGLKFHIPKRFLFLKCKSIQCDGQFGDQEKNPVSGKRETGNDVVKRNSDFLIILVMTQPSEVLQSEILFSILSQAFCSFLWVSTFCDETSHCICVASIERVYSWYLFLLCVFPAFCVKLYFLSVFMGSILEKKLKI